MKKNSIKSMAFALVSALTIAPMMPMIAYAAPTDSVTPTVSLTAPANGASLSGTVSITADATDSFSNCVVRIFGQSYDVSILGSTHSGGNVFSCGANQDAMYSSQHGTNVSRMVPYLLPASYVGVTKVEFYVDGNLVSTDTATPYSFDWNTSGVSNGSHALQAKAYDGIRIGNSSIVNVTINNSGTVTTPPTSVITTPPSASTVSGTIMVAADATGVPTVGKVEFYVDGVLKLTDITSPYQYSWDTTLVTNGSHTLQAKAYDPASNVGNSTPVTVTVNNTVTTPPTTTDTVAPVVSVTSPASGATVSGSATVSANATDSVGVTKVEFYVDGVIASTDSTSAYSFVWNTAAVSNGTHTIMAKAYDATGNVGTSSGVSVNVNNTTTQPPTTNPGHHDSDDDDDDEDEDEHEVRHSEREHERSSRRTENRSERRSSSRNDD